MVSVQAGGASKVKDIEYLVVFIMIGTLATFATRVLPFLFLSNKGEEPFLKHLSKNLPAGVMILLTIIFVVPLGHWVSPIYGLDVIIPVFLVIVVHRVIGSTLLSILVGTISYMVLEQMWVAGYF